ncbi:MAG: acyl-ACP--UDP-N-acetylglucosamine O-acyltransferase [Phycisphaerales bacterium]
MPTVHPTAVIDPAAEIHDEATIGPYCVITGPARIHAGARLIAHATINGPVTIGERTVVYPYAAIGFEPQDYKFAPGSRTAGVVIGQGCLIREHATIHAASNDHTPTTVGDRVFFMTSSHAGHDCTIGNDVVIISGALLAGHVTVQDRVTLGGGALVHQHVRIGRLAMLGGGVAISNDLPPFCTAYTENRVGGINAVGLRRNKLPAEEINSLRTAVNRYLRADLPRTELIEALGALAESSPSVGELRDFIVNAKRPICGGANKKPRGA